jgi:transcriptional regulator with XRE-family HTH domain
MTIGYKLQLLRKKSGLSQDQLAEKLHVTRQSVSKWELGESLPDIENIVKLSNTFGVTIDFLCKDDEIDDSNQSVVQSTKEKTSNFYHNRVSTFFSICLISIGGLGLATIWILSRFIVAFQWTAGEPPVIMPFDINQSPIYPRIETKGNYMAFVKTYHLEGLVIACVLAIIVSTFFLIIKNKKKSSDH